MQFSPKSLLHRRKALFLPPIDFFIVLARVAGIEPACLPMGIRTADNFLATPAYQNPPRKRAARRAGLGQADLPPLAWVDRTRHFFAHAACTPKSVSAPSCGRSLAERQRGLAPAYTGETPPYGTLCPCRCVKLWTNAPASMNTCCKAARTGCGPAGGFPCVVSRFSPAPYKSRRADAVRGGSFIP